jgi:UDP-N-acetylmuramoyl-tripeptide--D-alanyl-D-alanine ligase
MEIPELYNLFIQSTGVTIDSRNVENNQLFFALKGITSNGNRYAENAINSGAAYAIIDEYKYKKDNRFIVVDDVLSTLQQLSNFHLKQIQPKAVIAITGSNGKTTTKELVHAVLATTYKTHYTKGNLNNHIGIPITLLQMQKGTEIAVIEMGANHLKEIESYCKYVEPTHGIITNCGKAHLEGFGGIVGIRKGKGELFDYLKTHKGIIFFNGDEDVLKEMILERQIEHAISYGNGKSNEYTSKIINENPFLKIQFEEVEINANLYGSYNYSNLMCAIAVGKYFNVLNDNIKNAIESYLPTNARSQLIVQHGYHLILDAYNANPSSMQHALESFSKSTSQNKIVILGDMFELGEYTEVEHQKIADLAVHLGFSKIILVGNAFNNTNTPSINILKFKDTLETQHWFVQQDFTNAEILLKGSRSMKMEKIIE